MAAVSTETQGSAKPREEHESKYLLKNDELERGRLEDQHRWLTTHACHGRLIFDEGVEVKDGSCVLDAGTGTGIWLLELATQAPETVELHGIDLSVGFLPEVQPPNVHFSKASNTKLPEDWTNKFAFINQRLLVAAFQKRDWDSAVSEYFRTLKPGGHVQFLEYSTTWGKTELSKTQTKLMTSLGEAAGFVPDCGVFLPEWLAAAGFTNIKAHYNPAPVTAEGSPLAGAWRNLAEPLAKLGGFGIIKTKQEYLDMVDSLEEECRRENAQMLVHIICAQKPL